MPETPLWSHQQHSLPLLIADTLRKDIVNGLLEAGTRLRQEEVAARFDTSRIPVREAMRQLEAEGLLQMHPHRGAVVTALSPDELEEIFEIRRALETTALRGAIPHHNESVWQEAEEILDASDREANEGPWNRRNQQFHRVLYVPAKRPRLLAMIDDLYRQTTRYEHRARALTGYQERAQVEHRQILAACRDQDSDTAVTLLDQHIAAFSAAFVGLLREAL